MASSQSSVFTKAILLFLLFLNTLAFSIPLSDRSVTTRTDFPCISKCLSDCPASDTSVCKDSTIDVDKCLCAMVKRVAPKATFANCVESCNQEERNKLRGICRAGQVGGNDSEKAVSGGNRETDPIILASTSPKNQTNDDDNGEDGDDDGDDDDDDDDDKPLKAPDVPVRKNTTNTNKNNTSNTSNTTNTKNQDKKSSANLLVKHTGWTGIGAAVVAMMLMGLI